MPRWIKIREDLPDDPKTQAIARRLKLSNDAVVGKLVRLWAWANHHLHAEDVQMLDPGWLDAFVSQSGFTEAMVAVGWIAVIPTGLRFVNFREHNWQEGKKKALTADRVARHRAKPSRSCNAESVTCNAPSVTEALPNAYPPTPIPLLPSEEEKKVAVAPVSFPEPLNTQAFRAAWDRWIAYRREAKKPAWKPVTVKSQLRELAAWGEVQAIAAIETSIRNGWSGLFEPKEKSDGRSPAGRTQPLGQPGRIAAPPGKYDHLGGPPPAGQGPA